MTEVTEVTGVTGVTGVITELTDSALTLLASPGAVAVVVAAAAAEVAPGVAAGVGDGSRGSDCDAVIDGVTVGSSVDLGASEAVDAVVAAGSAQLPERTSLVSVPDDVTDAPIVAAAAAADALAAAAAASASICMRMCLGTHGLAALCKPATTAAATTGASCTTSLHRLASGPIGDSGDKGPFADDDNGGADDDDDDDNDGADAVAVVAEKEEEEDEEEEDDDDVIVVESLLAPVGTSKDIPDTRGC